MAAERIPGMASRKSDVLITQIEAPLQNETFFMNIIFKRLADGVEIQAWEGSWQYCWNLLRCLLALTLSKQLRAESSHIHHPSFSLCSNQCWEE